MRIDAPEENQIIIELSAEDMSALNITYEEMDYSNIETRRVVWTLLDKAGHVLNRDIDPSGKMIIEAVPSRSGGCVMKFTLCHNESHERFRCIHPVIHKEGNLTVYEFSSLDNIMDAAAACSQEMIQGTSEVYEQKGKYRLIFRSKTGDSRCGMTLCEFGREIGSGDIVAARTREHWRCIVESNALQKLGNKHI